MRRSQLESRQGCELTDWGHVFSNSKCFGSRKGNRIPHRQSLLRRRGKVKAFLNAPKGIEGFSVGLASSWGWMQGEICNKLHPQRKLPSCDVLPVHGRIITHEVILSVCRARFSSHVRRVQKDRRGELNFSSRRSMARYSFRVPFRKNIIWFKDFSWM